MGWDLTKVFGGSQFDQYELVVPLSVSPDSEGSVFDNAADTTFAYVIKDGHASVLPFDRNELSKYTGSIQLNHMNPEVARDYQVQVASDAAYLLSGTQHQASFGGMGINLEDTTNVDPANLPALKGLLEDYARSLQTEPMAQGAKEALFTEIETQISAIDEAMPLVDYAKGFVADVVDGGMALDAGVDPAWNDQIATLAMASAADAVDMGYGPAALIIPAHDGSF